MKSVFATVLCSVALSGPAQAFNFGDITKGLGQIGAVTKQVTSINCSIITNSFYSPHNGSGTSYDQAFQAAFNSCTRWHNQSACELAKAERNFSCVNSLTGAPVAP